MNILIVGCGKVGAQLATYLCRLGHDVSIVDRREESFDLLGSDFTGFVLTGVPIDRDVLKRAGIQGCDAVAALSEDDNVNVMVSQVARELFGVPRVIARVYDPQRKEVFSQFGLKTICPTNLTVEAVYSILMDTDDSKQITFDSTVVSFDTLPMPDQFVGCLICDLPRDDEDMLFGILHRDGSISFAAGQTGRQLRLSEYDRLIYAKIVD